MGTFVVSLPGGRREKFSECVPARVLFERFFGTESSVYGLMCNGTPVLPCQVIGADAVVEPVREDTVLGAALYRRTARLLFATAFHSVYPHVRLFAGYRVQGGYCYRTEGACADDLDVSLVVRRMKALVAQDAPIHMQYMTRQEALNLFTQWNFPYSHHYILGSYRTVFLTQVLDGFSALFFQPLMASVGRLTVFEVRMCAEGCLLRFPEGGQRHIISQHNASPQFVVMYRRHRQQEEQTKICSVGQLNACIQSGDVATCVDMAEAAHNRQIECCATEIARRDSVRVVSIAGPSGSGKTTIAKKLSVQLQVLGYDPHVISLDDYYVGIERTPCDAEGNPDFECVEALDLPLINKLFLDLLQGKRVALPSYNFKTGKREYRGREVQFGERSLLIIEGIHGLNDRLISLMNRRVVFRLYVSVFMHLCLDEQHRVSASDGRLLRRVVRDAQFRGISVEKTLEMWQRDRKSVV